MPLRGSRHADFGEVCVMQDKIRRKIYVFCAKLCYSKVESVKSYLGESTEFFFDGLTLVFDFFGGVPI
ncbi:hypothetical protein [Petrotoga sp. SL27]|uniref:hypothetical protein n=1 Tax=Petrotoga sp. SL27 TaxID=1445612 RepID=UPI000CDE987A|nr:hypothetical protein [Petrotoga sp. SL27]